MEEPALKRELQHTYILISIEKKKNKKQKTNLVFMFIELYRQQLNAISIEAM